MGLPQKPFQAQTNNAQKHIRAFLASYSGSGQCFRFVCGPSFRGVTYMFRPIAGVAVPMFSPSRAERPFTEGEQGLYWSFPFSGWFQDHISGVFWLYLRLKTESKHGATEGELIDFTVLGMFFSFSVFWFCSFLLGVCKKQSFLLPYQE